MKFLNKIRALLAFYYIYRKEVDSLNIERLFEAHDICLVTICFNKVQILKLQYQYLVNNLLDDFQYVIADNSNRKSASEEIKRFAEKNNLVYIKLPANPFSSFDPSKSHGLAINFTYRKITSINNSKFIGFIDQDIFPMQKTSIIKKMGDRPYYGLPQNRKKGLYLWAGFCFFNRDFLSDKKVNFMPIKGLDTGGGNYKIYDQDMVSNISIKHYYVKVDSGEIIKSTYEGIQNECVEYIDEWVHIMNSSGWFMNNFTGKKNDVIKTIFKNTSNEK